MAAGSWLRVVGALVAMRWRESAPRYLALVLTLALSVLAWLGLSSLVGPFVGGTGPSGAHVNVMSERNGMPFPLRHAERIRALEGVESTAHMAVLAVSCDGSEGWASLNGWGGDGVATLLRARDVPDALIAAWQGGESHVLVGDRLAGRCGWREGMDVQPQTLLGQRMPLRIVGIIEGQEGYGSQIALAHHAYLARHLPPEQQAQAWLVAVAPQDARVAAELGARIEALFEGEPVPLRATASGDAEGALARFGNVERLLMVVMAAFAACTVLVFGSVLAHMAVQRRRTMAMLLALGFRTGQLQCGFIIEVVALVVAGTGLGWLVALPAVAWMDRGLGPLLGALSIPTASLVALAPALLALGVLALLSPMSTLARLEPTDARAH